MKARLLLAGTVALLASAAPAHAAATQSVCDYNPATKQVVINDFSGGAELRLLRRGEELMISEGFADSRFCFLEGTNTTATVRNTERITIFSAPGHVGGGYQFDQSDGRFAPGATPETDGDSEIEIVLVTTGAPAQLRVSGTKVRDVMSVGKGGKLNFSYDADIDIDPQTKPSNVFLSGGVGDDEVDSNGGGIFALPADVPVRLQGDAGNDSVVLAGSGFPTQAFGGFGDDRMFSSNGTFDVVDGGPGTDLATVERKDKLIAIEQALLLEPVGKLRFAGGAGRAELSWTHPKGWKRLRSVRMLVHRGADVVGAIAIDPKDGSVRGEGEIELTSSKLAHTGKIVSARLAFHMDGAEPLRVSVEATDRDGRTHVEPQAGIIRGAA